MVVADLSLRFSTGRNQLFGAVCRSKGKSHAVVRDPSRPLGGRSSRENAVPTAPKRPAWVTHALSGDFGADPINSSPENLAAPFRLRRLKRLKPAATGELSGSRPTAVGYYHNIVPAIARELKHGPAWLRGRVLHRRQLIGRRMTLGKFARTFQIRCRHVGHETR